KNVISLLSFIITMDFDTLVLAGGLISAIVFYIRAHKRWVAFKSTLKAIVDAIEDDKITADELQRIIENAKKLVSD
ncbi:MAG: hypothetical protein QXM92_04030, partial [Candidatus Anstonellales archaeon]